MANAVIIGETVVGFYRYTTWGRLRTVFAFPSVSESSNVEYPIFYPGTNTGAFKSAATGSGLIKGDRILSILENNQYLSFRTQGFNSQFNPSPPPTFVADFRLELQWWNYTSNNTLVPLEVQNELIGQAVTLSVGSPFNISIDLFTISPGKQTFLLATPISPGEVTAIGKLTPIT